MRIVVVGAGGTGGYFGGLLARAGEDVTFIARGAHLEALRMRGLTVESRLAGTFRLPVRATDDPSEVDPVDLIFFCVKTYDTEAAAESVRPLIYPNTMMLSLQNGIDNDERIARVTGHKSGVGAVAYVVSTIKAPGVVEQTAGPGKIILGELVGGTSPRTEQLHGVLQRAGISAEVHPDVRIVSGKSSSSSAPSAASQPSPGCLSERSWRTRRLMPYFAELWRRQRLSRGRAGSACPRIAWSRRWRPPRPLNPGDAARSTTTLPVDGGWSWNP